MRKRGSGRSRSDIGGELEGHDRKLQEHEQETTDGIEDEETVDDLRQEYEGGGTQEGLESVRGGLESTLDVAHDIYSRRDGELGAEQGDTDAFGAEMQGESDTVNRDIGKTEHAEGRTHVRETLGELGRVEAALREDLEFLENHARDARERLAESERIRKALESRIRR